MPPNEARVRPTVGIFGLTGCAGDQLVVLNCEDRLLDLVDLVDIRDFAMAASGGDTACALDLAFVEGAVVTHRDEERLREIRERARTLIAIGTCAVWGGVAALDRATDRPALTEEIYGPYGRGYGATPARPLRDVVPVDWNITGCPIERDEFLEAVAHLLNGNPPLIKAYPVCGECRMRECNCLLVDGGQVCCGPVTAAGCNARCPALGVPCIGCRGPLPDANFASAVSICESHHVPTETVLRKLGTFAPVPETVEAI
jgi:sulfhydrogenase subunit delta